jgi:hypothetical protein
MRTEQKLYAVCDNCLEEFYADLIYYANNTDNPNMIKPNALYSLVMDHHLDKPVSTHNIFDLFVDQPDHEVLLYYYLQNLRAPNRWGNLTVSTGNRPIIQIK